MERISVKQESDIFTYTFNNMYNHFEEQTVPIMYANISRIPDLNPADV